MHTIWTGVLLFIGFVIGCILLICAFALMGGIGAAIMASVDWLREDNNKGALVGAAIAIGAVILLIVFG